MNVYSPYSIKANIGLIEKFKQQNAVEEKKEKEYNVKSFLDAIKLYTEELKRLDVNAFPDAHNLSFILSTAKFSVKNDEWVDIILLNHQEEKILLSNKTNILSFIENRTQCKKINLNIKVKEYSHKPKLYEPREVLQFMKEKNPNISELVKVLGAEINY